MDCRTARLALLDDHRGHLDAAAAASLAAHLEECAACAREDTAERVLTEQLERQLPQHAAPIALKRRLAAQWPAPSAAAQSARLSRSWWWGAAALTALVVLALMAAWVSLSPRESADRLVAEAVTDHLRVLGRLDRLDVRSGDMHEVRPWLTSRLEFAPVIPFAGDADFPLRGGTVEYFLDRRAAVAVYGRRLHAVRLLVARPDGLPWPAPGRPLVTRSRGFNVRLWQSTGLGYALVSDLDGAELGRLASRLGG